MEHNICTKFKFILPRYKMIVLRERIARRTVYNALNRRKNGQSIKEETFTSKGKSKEAG
jgi:hypothetical protein